MCGLSNDQGRILSDFEVLWLGPIIKMILEVENKIYVVGNKKYAKIRAS